MKFWVHKLNLNVRRYQRSLFHARSQQRLATQLLEKKKYSYAQINLSQQ